MNAEAPLPAQPSDPQAQPPVLDRGLTQPDAGIALCLSGGGYRAMLFHVGALWRLNELGWLQKLDRVSSVSGGSITAGLLGARWQALQFSGGVATNLDTELVRPIRALAAETIDVRAVLAGILIPGKTVAGMVAAAYRKHLFATATLQTLPDAPRFVINATNLQTGVLWRFSKPYMADYTIGLIPNPKVELATAVAASSAFPPILSPLRLKLQPTSFSPEGLGANFKEPFDTTAVLSDGGVYDNLGLETAWKSCKTVLVSDGGGRMQPEPSVHGDWIRQATRELGGRQPGSRPAQAPDGRWLRARRTRRCLLGDPQRDRELRPTPRIAALPTAADGRARVHPDTPAGDGCPAAGTADQLGLRDL
jgi:NTE family protein